MTNSTFVYCITIIILLVTRILNAVPLDSVTDATSLQVDDTTLNAAKISTGVSNSNGANESTSTAQESELEAAASEQTNVQTAKATPSGSGNYDPSAAASSMYASFLTPEAIQQYVNQIGAAYPGYAAYPAPIGYAPAVPPLTPPQPPPPGAAPVYPGPYVVQTGYEGYLVPATATSTEITQNNGPLAYLANIFSVLMMSTLFRAVATIFAAIGMLFFGGALSRLICNLTPICTVSSTAVEYFKRNKGNAEQVGRMIAEGMTPERVRRATEIVQNAIRKYQQLQMLVEVEGKEK